MDGKPANPSRRCPQEQAEDQGEGDGNVHDDATAQDDGLFVDPNLPKYMPPKGINIGFEAGLGGI